MSDDDSLGHTCCIPRRVYLWLLAAGFTVYGCYQWLYFIIGSYMSAFTMTPSHCSGSKCSDVLTCDATLESTYHFRLIVLSIGSLVFGVMGINAIHNKYTHHMYLFAWWIVTVAVLLLACMVMDGAYTVICRSHYPYNVISEAILWPVRIFPVPVGIKYEIRGLDKYPKQYVDALVMHNVTIMYACFELIKVLFLIHAAYNAFILAQRFHYGVAGMGANFSIEGWRKRLMMRYEINEVAYNTFDMAVATGMDLGWEENEFHLQRPIRTPHWYRGNVGAAKAYDGFRDDRRNVLL